MTQGPNYSAAYDGNDRNVKIALLTRMTTQNAGNEALSAELINFISSNFPRGHIRGIDRFPHYLEQFTISFCRKFSDNVEEGMDVLAHLLIKRFSPNEEGHLTSMVTSDNVRLTHDPRELPHILKSIKRRVGFRRNLAKWTPIGRGDFERVLNTCAWSEILIWNPAGEIHPTGDREEVFRLLLIVRIAQMLGRRTAIINHSIEVEDAQLRAILAHVYRSADLVIVRDSESKRVAFEFGCDQQRLLESPDLVFLVGRQRQPARQSRGIIGLAINGKEAMRGENEWFQLLSNLVQFGKPIVFLSNGMNHDIPFVRKFANTFSIEIIHRQPGYWQLRQLYSEMEVLISSRLHAAILAISAGVAVISIEPQLFKLTSIFEQMRYPYRTDNLLRAGWSKRVIEKVRDAFEHREYITRVNAEIMQTQIARIHATYAQLFSLMEDDKLIS
jgi:polysaccharide pyruvyl transferase WcaK-like protein